MSPEEWPLVLTLDERLCMLRLVRKRRVELNQEIQRLKDKGNTHGPRSTRESLESEHDCVSHIARKLWRLSHD